MQEEVLQIDVEADTAKFDQAMDRLTNSTKEFGSAFSTTIRQSIRTGKSFEDTLKSIGKRFADIALKRALAPVDNAIGSFIGSTFGNVTGALTKNLVGQGTPVTPFAKGGVVTSPTLFDFSGQKGVMGEAGAEAILPLARGSNGRLGVATSDGGNKPVSIVFNVTTNDANSFKKSEVQLTSMLARAVGRGQRGL